MSSLKFAENIYSFRVYESVVAKHLTAAQPELAPLAAIEARLVEASNLFNARRYQDAIRAYNAASSMIYAHLNPRAPRNSNWDLAVVPDGQLFKPLLSASLEWLNVLPVAQPEVTVRPRVPVDEAVLGQAAVLNRVGLFSSKLVSGAALDAAADLQVAQALRTQGNESAANFFVERARAADAGIVARLTPPPSGAVAGVSGLAGLLQTRPALASSLWRSEGLSPALQVSLGEANAAAATAVQAQVTAAAARLPLPASVTAESRVLGALVAGQPVTFEWAAGAAAPLDQVEQSIYKARVNLTDLEHIIGKPALPADVALNLPHNYYYVIPLGLAECYHALGDFARAEASYFQAAGYQYLNQAIEAPYLWGRLAELYLNWGDSLFRDEETLEARDIYERVLLLDGSEPASTLYTTAALAPGADAGRMIIAHLGELLNGQTDAETLDVNPLLVATILEVHAQLVKIGAGLDFWGHWHASVPIWTFEYLHSAAVNFTQLAVGAERDFIQFQERADQSALTRQQLQQGVSLASAERAAAQQQSAAAQAEASAYEAALNTAQQRAANAQANADEYAQTSEGAILFQALSAQMGGGDNGNADQLNAYADAMMGIGETAEFLRKNPGWRLSGSRGTMAAGAALASARLNRQYEVDALQHQAADMQSAAVQAQAELNAARARARAVKAAERVASARLSAACQSLSAFDSQYFTPDVWGRLAAGMRAIYRRYLDMAIRTARLMQQAYNFETDQSLKLIKSDYSGDEVKGLLGADLLMADIQGFTFDLITNTRNKPQPLRQTISLSERYGFAFETQLRRTGVMEFETRIADFDEVYPGTYAGRIEAVEVEVDGIVPPTGISGALTNGGISFYRTPAADDQQAGDMKIRVQSRETMVISDYDPRGDALLNPEDRRMLRIFQGAGLASTWRLELPRGLNDLDYGALTDVRLTLHYKARFDPELRERVLQELAARPGVNARQRGIPLRWIYPDAFFHFQDTGELRITLSGEDFRRNETQPALTDVSILVITDGSRPAGGLTLALSTPGRAALSATTDVDGAIQSSTPGSSWAALTGGSAVGDYVLMLDAGNNPDLVENGRLNLSPIVNVALILGYSFTPKA